jgi:hypothetical protein
MLENILLWSLPTTNRCATDSAARQIASICEHDGHGIASSARETTATEVPVASTEA